MKRKVVIADHREEGFIMEKKAFASEEAELVICSCDDEGKLIEIVRDAYIIIFTSSRMTGNIIRELTNCRMLIRYGVGLENVDIEAATEKGIYVCNTPDYGTFAVAEHAFALLISLNRKLPLLDSLVRRNIWDLESAAPVYSLRHKILGIAGFGNIGRHICKMAQAFEMKVIVFDPYVDDEIINKFQVQKTTLDELITNSDHITIHAPLTRETINMFDAAVFSKMKNTATIINTSRGGLINQNDLIEALKCGRIAGAGLDVFENEPLSSGNELLKMKNVVLTPHVAWYTEESIINLHQEVIDEVIRVLNGKEPVNAVNQVKKL